MRPSWHGSGLWDSSLPLALHQRFLCHLLTGLLIPHWPLTASQPRRSLGVDLTPRTASSHLPEFQHFTAGLAYCMGWGMVPFDPPGPHLTFARTKPSDLVEISSLSLCFSSDTRCRRGLPA